MKNLPIAMIIILIFFISCQNVNHPKINAPEINNPLTEKFLIVGQIFGNGSGIVYLNDKKKIPYIDAVISMNGQTLIYNSEHKCYITGSIINAGDQVKVKIKIESKEIVNIIIDVPPIPIIKAPIDSTIWNANENNDVEWILSEPVDTELTRFNITNIASVSIKIKAVDANDLKNTIKANTFLTNQKDITLELWFTNWDYLSGDNIIEGSHFESRIDITTEKFDIN